MGALANLTFLDGFFALGVVALAVPLLVHLISRRRARDVRFAPIALLLRSRKKTARSLRLRQLVLLALRTLLLLLLLLAIGRPVWQRDVRAAVSSAPLVVEVVVDVSASMHAVLNGTAIGARALALALDEARAPPADVQVGALACASTPREVAPPSFDRAGVLAALSALQLTYAHADLRACVNAAIQSAAAVPGAGERRIVVLSDLARSGLPSADDGAAVAFDVAGKNVSITWRVPVDAPAPPNHAVLDAEMTRVFGPAGEALHVSYAVAQFGGAEPAADVEASLRAGSRTLAQMSVAAGNDGTVHSNAFHHALAAAAPASKAAEPPPAPTADAVDGGDDDVSVVLAPDALAADDVLVIPRVPPKPVQVLVVDGAPQAVAFRDEVFYLESALSDAKGARVPLRVRVESTDQLTPATFADARVVILANVARLPDAVATALVEHAKSGAGVFVSMGDQVDVEWWNTHMQTLLPLPLRGPKGQAILDDSSVALALTFSRFRVDHPIFQAIAGADDEVAGLLRVQTSTYFLLEPDAADGPSAVLARFSNGAPALLEKQVGDGRVLFLATTVDRDWTDLPIRPGYLPLLHQSVAWLAGALSGTDKSVLIVGAPHTIPLPRGTARVELRTPDGTRRPIDLAAHDASTPPSAALVGLDVPGLYHVWAAPADGDLRELKTARFSVVIDPRESDLRRAEDAELDGLVPSGVRTARAGDDGDTPLWPALLAFLVLTYALEAAAAARAAGRRVAL